MYCFHIFLFFFDLILQEFTEECSTLEIPTFLCYVFTFQVFGIDFANAIPFKKAASALPDTVIFPTPSTLALIVVQSTFSFILPTPSTSSFNSSQ